MGHTRLGSPVCYVGIEVDDVLEIAQQTGVSRRAELRSAYGCDTANSGRRLPLTVGSTEPTKS